MTEDKERDEALIAEIAEVFPPDTVDVQSRYVIVHQLRASADIQDAQTKRETGWADTSDRACLMRKAADALDALLAKLQPAPKPDRQMKLARECAARLAQRRRDHDYAGWIREGRKDNDSEVQSALLAIQVTEARAQGLVDALEPFEKALGKRQLLCKDDESVTWSAITVGDLRKARQALATWRRT